MLTRCLIPILFLAAAEQPTFGPIRFEDSSRKAGIAFTHSFGARQFGIFARKHGSRRGVVRLQQRWVPGPVRGFRKAAGGGDAPIPVTQVAGSAAAQPSLP